MLGIKGQKAIWLLGLPSPPPLPSTTMAGRTPSPSSSDKEKKIFNAGVDTSGVDERKLLRKIDIALIPWLSFLYLLSFLDRTSIGK